MKNKNTIVLFLSLFCAASALSKSNETYIANYYPSQNDISIDGKYVSLLDWANNGLNCKEKKITRGEYETKEEFNRRVSKYAKNNVCDSLRYKVKTILKHQVKLNYDADKEKFSFYIENISNKPKFRRSNAPKDDFCVKILAPGKTTRIKYSDQFFSSVEANFDTFHIYKNRVKQENVEFIGIELTAKSDISHARELKSMENSLFNYVYAELSNLKPSTPAQAEYCKNSIELTVRMIAMINNETDDKLIQVLFKN